MHFKLHMKSFKKDSHNIAVTSFEGPLSHQWNKYLSSYKGYKIKMSLVLLPSKSSLGLILFYWTEHPEIYSIQNSFE